MGFEAFVDPLFRVPLAAGCLVAAVLPLLGVFLRLRDEWLAALGLAHLAAAGGILGLAAGVPVVVAAPAVGALGAVSKGLFGSRGNTAYGLMILAGWSAALIAGANTRLGSAAGHALVEGQLYFARWPQLAAAGVVFGVVAALLPWLSRRLLRARLFPHHDRANRLPAWRWQLGFDLLVAVAMAVGTATLGLMGAFALVLVPAWVAFRAAPGWRATGAVSVALGVSSYLAAFAAAAALDQPFGPVLVATLLIGAAAFAVPWRLTGHPLLEEVAGDEETTATPRPGPPRPESGR